LIAPQDRHAIEDWIADQADEQKGRDIIASLPSLSTGQGWVWALEHFHRDWNLGLANPP
jgi:hypothetical protein